MASDASDVDRADDNRTALERRLIVQADFLRDLIRYPSTEEALREAATLLAEQRRALEMSREITIEVRKRSHDYHAQIAGEPGIWAAGSTPAAAIGDLVQSHSGRFGVRISYPEDRKLEG